MKGGRLEDVGDVGGRPFAQGIGEDEGEGDEEEEAREEEGEGCEGDFGWGAGGGGHRMEFLLLPLWEKVPEGRMRGPAASLRIAAWAGAVPLTRISAGRRNPPSPTRGEGGARAGSSLDMAVSIVISAAPAGVAGLPGLEGVGDEQGQEGSQEKDKGEGGGAFVVEFVEADEDQK